MSDYLWSDTSCLIWLLLLTLGQMTVTLTRARKKAIIGDGMYVFREWLAVRRSPRDRAHRAWQVLKSWVFGEFARFSRRVTQLLYYIPYYPEGYTGPKPNRRVFMYNVGRSSQYYTFSQSRQEDWWEYFLDYWSYTMGAAASWRINRIRNHPLRVKDISEF